MPERLFNPVDTDPITIGTLNKIPSLFLILLIQWSYIPPRQKDHRDQQVAFGPCDLESKR
jgi:hypothetical protein